MRGHSEAGSTEGADLRRVARLMQDMTVVDYRLEKNQPVWLFNRVAGHGFSIWGRREQGYKGLWSGYETDDTP